MWPKPDDYYSLLLNEQLTQDIKQLSIHSNRGDVVISSGRGPFEANVLVIHHRWRRIHGEDRQTWKSERFFSTFRFVSLVRGGRNVGWLTRIAGPFGPGISTQPRTFSFLPVLLSFCPFYLYYSPLSSISSFPIFLCWCLSNKNIGVWCSTYCDCLSFHSPNFQLGVYIYFVIGSKVLHIESAVFLKMCLVFSCFLSLMFFSAWG